MRRINRLLLLMLLGLMSFTVVGGVGRAYGAEGQGAQGQGKASGPTDQKLLEMIKFDQADKLREVIRNSAGVENRALNNGMPLLQLCIEHNSEKVFKVLLNDEDTNVNIPDRNGRTPLIYCAQRVMPEFARTLLETGGVKISTTDKRGNVALSYVQGMDLSKAQKRIERFELKDTPEQVVEKAKDFVQLLSQYQGNLVLSEDMVLSWMPESIRPIFRKQIMGVGLWRYLVSLLIILLILIVNTLAVFYIKKLSKRYDAEESGSKRSFVGMTIFSLRRAFKVLIWGFGLYIVVALLMPHILESAHWAAEVISSITVALFIYDFTAVLEYYLMEWAGKTENKLDDTLVMLFRRSMRIGVVILVSLHVYHAITNNPITGVLAGLGIGSMAVALAATDTLKNLIGFFMIIMDKPFTLGERIKFDGHDGIVENIGMRTTRIRRLDGHEVSIPNSKAVDSVIHNIGRRPFIKRVMSIGLTYDTPADKMEKAIEILKDILKDHEGMNPEKPPLVFFNDMKADCLNIDAYYWYYPANWVSYEEFSMRVNLEIMRRFEAEGLDFAFPSQTIYLADDVNRRLVLSHKFENGGIPFTSIDSTGSDSAK